MRSRVWQVQAGGPRTLGEVLRALGEEPSALAEGRVWVGRARATDASLVLEPGARVTVHASRPRGERASVVERADGFVIAYKPAALPTEPDRAGGACLTRQLAELLGVGALHAVSRLDVGVSGLALLTETKAAHRRAAALREAGAIARRYLAIAERAPPSESGVTRAPVAGRAAATHWARAALARPHWLPSGERTRPALLVLDPQSGRKHQLRLHACELGAPLLGDRAHGGARRLTAEDGRVLPVPRVMLHAARLELPRADGSSWVLAAPPPEDFAEIWCALGGAREDLERASAMG